MTLPKHLRMLLLVNAVSYIIFIYIGIFVNLYIWEMNKEIFDVAWFNLVMFILWGVAFAAGGKLLMHYSIRLLCVLSALSGGIAFLLLTFLEIESRTLWIAIIGVPVGLMWGFFSAAQSLSISLVAKGKDISNFYAMINIISQTLSVIVPLLSAWTIIKFGYSSTFMLMLFFIVIILIICYFLPQIALKTIIDDKQEGTLFQKMHLSKVFSAPNSKWIILSCLAAGFFLQFQNLFVLLFTFNITQDKTMIALLSAIYTLVSVASFLVYQKVKIGEDSWLFLGVIFIAIGFIMVIYPLPPILILSNILTTVGMFYFSVIWNAQIFHLISDYSPVQKARFLIWREWLLVISRCGMLVIILNLKSFQGITYILLISIALVCLLLIPILQKKALRGMEYY